MNTPAARVSPGSNASLAYALLRFTLGINMLLHGLVRLVPGPSGFADTLVQGFANTPLPGPLVYAFAWALPFAEAVVGALLILGLWTRLALVAGGLLMAAAKGIARARRLRSSSGAKFLARAGGMTRSDSRWPTLRRATTPAMRLLWTGVAAVVLGVGAVGCKNNCQTSADCRAGEVCMRIAPEHDEGVLQCVVQCDQWDWPSSECADAGVPGRCLCPDSPAGARCSVVDAPPPDSGTYYCDGEQ